MIVQIVDTSRYLTIGACPQNGVVRSLIMWVTREVPCGKRVPHTVMWNFRVRLKTEAQDFATLRDPTVDAYLQNEAARSLIIVGKCEGDMC